MSRNGKRYTANEGKVETDVRYSLDDALGLVKECANAKFDESVDIAVRLGVNPRQADQMVRGAVSLPHGIGKTNIVVVFAEGDAVKEAEEAGADFVGSNDLIEKIAGGWTEFDKAVSTRAMMAKVGRLGRVLGPRGLMPNPKTGTVVAPEDIGRVVKEVKGGRIDFRVERAGIIHTTVGKASMDAGQLRENILALVATLNRLKPSTAKGTYIRGVALSSTMGPGVRLDNNEVTRDSQDYRG
jgi:large subunit ribosomal protein L1